MKKTFTFILSALSIANTSFAASEASIKVSNDIKKIEAKYGGKVGVYTINRNDGDNIDHNASFYFPVCSTYKFLVVGAILKKSMTDENLLNEKIKIPENEIVGYSPFTKKHIGKNVTIKELCKASIGSDNTATNLLIHKLGGLKELRKFSISLGDYATKVADSSPDINNVDLTTNLNKTTPKIMARDINKLAFSDEILDKKRRIMFKDWLIDQNTETRIGAEIPDNWEIGNKIGTCDYGTTNDVAILWPEDGRAIAMSVFYTQADKDAKPNNKVAKKVAKVVLDNLDVDNSDNK